MKIAVGIIGLLLGLLVLLQSCTVAATGSLASNQGAGEAGMVGIIVALLYVVGGAFAFGLPIVSAITFTLAAMLAFAVSGDFSDMRVWGFVALGLAVLAFFAWRSARTKASPGNS